MTNATITLPNELRDRLRDHARRDRVSQAVVIERALDLLDQEAFFTTLCRDVVESCEDASARIAREAWLGGPVVTEGAGK